MEPTNFLPAPLARMNQQRCFRIRLPPPPPSRAAAESRLTSPPVLIATILSGMHFRGAAGTTERAWVERATPVVVAESLMRGKGAALVSPGPRHCG
jgi:hypothetical protein